MKFNIVGDILGTSGYANHTRSLFNALAKKADVSLQSQVPLGFETQVNDAELDAIKKQNDTDRINIIITMPHLWKLNLVNKRNWVYLIWEGDKIPKSYLEECENDKIEKIIVASNHTLEAVKNTIIDMRPDKEDGHFNDLIYTEILQKFIVIPHGVDINNFYPKFQDVFPGEMIDGKLPNRPFTFLINKGLRNLEDRGGSQYAIKAYLEEFTNKDNVHLVVKVNPAYGIPNFVEMFPELKDKNRPKITFLANNMSKSELNQMYNNCDVFVSTTRAEAFNLPCLEALACGKPVITTNFGGQTDFINKDNGWLIKGKLTKVEHELLYDGIKWLTPDIKEIKETMRIIYYNREYAKPDLNKMSENCIKTASKYTWENTANKFLETTKFK